MTIGQPERATQNRVITLSKGGYSHNSRSIYLMDQLLPNGTAAGMN